MFKINRKDRIMEIIHGEQKIEYPIEETQKLIDMLPYEEEYTKLTFIGKIKQFIHNPFITPMWRVFWLIGRLMIASFAGLGLYTILNSDQFINKLPEYSQIIKYIFYNFNILIQIYVSWDIISTLIKLYGDFCRMRISRNP